MKLETLQSYTGSRNTDISSFKRNVRKALTKLVEVGFLSSFKIEKDFQVDVKRALRTLKAS